MRIEAKRIIKTALIVLMLLNLAFIFVQSLIPPEESSKESGAVGEIIEDIIPPETKPGEFIQINLRKIAHFVEFACLGTTVALYLVLFINRHTVAILLSFPAALIVGFIDESIQLFSGRGASVKDVWIDFFGFLFASIIVYTGYLIFHLIHKNVNKNCHNTTME